MNDNVDRKTKVQLNILNEISIIFEGEILPFG